MLCNGHYWPGFVSVTSFVTMASLLPVGRSQARAAIRQEEFHPKPLTEPFVILSHHTARLTYHYFRFILVKVDHGF